MILITSRVHRPELAIEKNGKLLEIRIRMKVLDLAGRRVVMKF